MADKDIIVALELATTAVRAIAGQRMADGTMQIKAIVEENASNCIRKGIVDNIDKTTQAISRVLGQVSLQLGQSVRRVYVGMGGQSLHTVVNKIQRP
nr:cell division protein FtsA [Bacteroidaceae bacterium]